MTAESSRRPILSAAPKAEYLAARAEIDAAVRRVLESGRYILGPEVEAFEREFAAWLGVAAVAGVANGTDALELALRALGVGPGDRVATVAHTVTATVAAITAVGAQPAYVDIESESMLMDPAALERVLAGGGVKVVVPVHLYGRACDLPRIVALARRHGTKVLEDCAQAHGALVGGAKAGTVGDLAAFSFYPTKNLGALGDGGAVAGQDAALVDRVRRLRQYGWSERYVSEEAGRNSRLDEVQAAILRVQLARLDAGNARRASLAARYAERLAGLPLRLPSAGPGGVHAWHQYAVRTARRDDLRAFLAAREIHCAVLYPVPVHRQPGFRADVNLPETDRAAAEVLSLPLHGGVTESDVDHVCAAVRAWFAKG